MLAIIKKKRFLRWRNNKQVDIMWTELHAFESEIFRGSDDAIEINERHLQAFN